MVGVEWSSGVGLGYVNSTAMRRGAVQCDVEWCFPAGGMGWVWMNGLDGMDGVGWGMGWGRMGDGAG